MVQPMQCRNLEPDERNSYPRGQRSDRAPVEAARKFIRAAALEQLVRNNPAFSQHVIVRDHHACDGAQKKLEESPAIHIDVAAVTRQQPPRLHQNSNNACNQPAGLETDLPRVQIRKSFAGETTFAATFTFSVASSSASMATTTATGFQRVITTTGSQIAPPNTTTVADVTAMPMNE